MTEQESCIPAAGCIGSPTEDACPSQSNRKRSNVPHPKIDHGTFYEYVIDLGFVCNRTVDNHLFRSSISMTNQVRHEARHAEYQTKYTDT